MVGEDEESDYEECAYEECAFAFFSPVEMPGEPATLKEALESSDAEEWKKAMESELKSIEENGTWELVELPEGCKAITSKWLFKIKSNADGKIEHYKSRLVAKGYQQKEKPEGFDDGSGRVLRLKKALYGLKQVPRQWYLKLRGVLEEIGFTPSTADHSLFMLGEGEQRSFMVVYVEVFLIFSPSSDLVKEVMLKLQDKFKCKALGDVSFYLGLHIERDVEKQCMRVHQRKYLEALAANFGQSEGHVATPFPSGFKCVKGPEEESVGEEERRRFHSLVGSLMYAAVNTRPDPIVTITEPASRPASPVCTFRTGHRFPRPRPPPVPSTHVMALRPSSVPQRVPLPSPPVSSLPGVPDPESDLARAASPTVPRLLATVVTDPSFESTTASALVAELVDFVAACRLNYATSLVAESESDCPLGRQPWTHRWHPGSPQAPTSMHFPLSGANIVDGIWIFWVKRPPGSPLVFKARYVCTRLHLHEEIWLRRPPGFTGSFLVGIQWSLRWPVYGLRQAPCEWHDTLRTTLAAFRFAPLAADPSPFLRTDTSLPPFYVPVYVSDLVFATADTEALALVNLELQKRHTCTDLAPPSDKSVEPSGPYLELVGCLMHLMTCTRPDLAYPLSILARYVAPGRHQLEHWEAVKKVLRYLCSTLGMGRVLGGRGPVSLTGHADASWVDDLATQRSSQGYTFSLGSGFISWRSTRSSSVLCSSCEAEIYAGAMAAQELRWLTYLLTDLGERPRSSPFMYVDNKAMIVLCHEHRLEHKTKHIALRYLFVRELQQCGQLRLAYVATRANTADVFTKALQSEGVMADRRKRLVVVKAVPLVIATHDPTRLKLLNRASSRSCSPETVVSWRWCGMTSCMSSSSLSGSGGAGGAAPLALPPPAPAPPPGESSSSSSLSW
ncbi:unnamed protein product [Closterium sp. NIES-54]